MLDAEWIEVLKGNCYLNAAKEEVKTLAIFKNAIKKNL
jgi:hypothetical protein